MTLTPLEIAEDLRIRPHTVYEWIRSGELPAMKIGSRFKIEEVDYERFKTTRKENWRVSK